MNPNTGEIFNLTIEEQEELQKQLGHDLMSIKEEEMTEKQKENQKVSLHDNRSILGKKAVKARRDSNYTPPKKNRKI